VETKKIPLEGHYLKRISKMNEWKEVPYEEVKGARYDYPFPAANALFIGTYRRPA
jgi:hypothetical protein